jgi:predicted porin
MVKYSAPLFGREALAAVSTYWGEEEVNNAAATAAALRTQKLRSVGTGLQGALPLGPVLPFGAFELRGSWFRATNMAKWNLGSNSSTANSTFSNTGSILPVHAHGGWAEVNWQITPKYGLALGGGRARDDRNDVRAIGGSSLKIQDNQGYWLMATWQDGPWGFMASVSNVDTMWVTPTTNAETRNDSQEIHLVFRYSF